MMLLPMMQVPPPPFFRLHLLDLHLYVFDVDVASFSSLSLQSLPWALAQILQSFGSFLCAFPGGYAPWVEISRAPVGSPPSAGQRLSALLGLPTSSWVPPHVPCRRSRWRPCGLQSFSWDTPRRKANSSSQRESTSPTPPTSLIWMSTLGESPVGRFLHHGLPFLPHWRHWSRWWCLHLLRSRTTNTWGGSTAISPRVSSPPSSGIGSSPAGSQILRRLPPPFEVLLVPVLNLLLNSSLNGWPLSIPSRFFTRHFSIWCTSSFDHLRCWCWNSCSWFGSRVFLFLPLPWNPESLQLYASTVFQTSTFIPTSHRCRCWRATFLLPPLGIHCHVFHLHQLPNLQDGNELLCDLHGHSRTH